MGYSDGKAAIMHEFVRHMLDSYLYGGKTCTYAGFQVHPLDMFKKDCT